MGANDQLAALAVQCAIALLQIIVPKLKKKIKEMRQKEER